MLCLQFEQISYFRRLGVRVPRLEVAEEGPSTTSLYERDVFVCPSETTSRLNACNGRPALQWQRLVRRTGFSSLHKTRRESATSRSQIVMRAHDRHDFATGGVIY